MMETLLQVWRIGSDGRVLLVLRLTPKAAKDAIDGIDSSGGQSNSGGSGAGSGGSGDAEGCCKGTAVVKGRVRAVPEKGKANAAAAKLIAKWLGLPKSSVTLVAGSKSRIKTFAIDGDADEIAAKLEAAIAALG